MIESAVLMRINVARGSAHNVGCGHKRREASASEQALAGSAEARDRGGDVSAWVDIVKGDDRGQRTINAEQAEIVRRIFAEYAEGKGPIAIVGDLNREGVPGPRGGRWNASALLGNPKRLNGILNNELYRGTIV
ncbi:MAG: recombinase family protein, partial [Alphaproteobacteria bacterium]|nr:recombinase family protein [Alphaproteobacteria bacterium]